MRTVEKREGSTYDITFSSEYYIEDTSNDRVTVECFVVRDKEFSLEWSNFSTQVDLIFPSGVSMLHYISVGIGNMRLRT